eukprot:Anaeramoba_flamelloidesa92148_24.p1 GENE.a92148_24~~a92148_24.p1  ORF type:complete len:239 (-),score=50.19 a92148_24:56-772(-)
MIIQSNDQILSRTAKLLKANCKLVLFSQGSTLTTLSKSSFKIMTNKFFHLIHNENELKQGLFFAMRFISLDLTSQEGTEMSTKFVTLIEDLFNEIKKKNERINLSVSVSFVLIQQAIEGHAINLKYTSWNNGINNLWNLAVEIAKLRKMNGKGLYFLTAILCCLDKANFLQKKKVYLSFLFKSLKDKSARRHAILCSSNFLRVFLMNESRYENKKKTLEVLKTITERAFSLKKKKKNS